ncbi:MAG: hypothetical protein GY704_00110 [Phycisphaeraceae bacterium]|nr:hypothetical protein [Phycisphaeraceae bacterium]
MTQSVLLPRGTSCDCVKVNACRTDDDVLEDFFGVRPFATVFAPTAVKDRLLEIRREERSADRSSG